MQAIVHIGMSKTGSTALQGCLEASRDYLATRGLLYPTNPPPSTFNNHRLLAAQFVPFEKLPRDVTNRTGYTAATIGGAFEAFVAHVAREAAERRPAGLVLSSEALFRGLPQKRREAIRGAYRRLGAAPRFIAYLRRPSEHYLSILLQVLTASSAVTPPRPRRYRGVIEAYEETFGAGTVAVRLYHRAHLERGDIVADFCAHGLGAFAVAPERLTPAPRVNDTLSAEAMDIVARYRRAFHGQRDDVYTPDTTLLRRALAEIDRDRGCARPRLRPEVAEAIDYASHDCLWVRDRFGVVFPELDYARLGAAPATLPEPARQPPALAELIVIDREAQAGVLDDLARSPWAAAEPGRTAWIAAQRAPEDTKIGKTRRARAEGAEAPAPGRPGRRAKPRGEAAARASRSEGAARASRSEGAATGMRTILHIGMPKTGSTALQQALLQSHDALRARGVLYPKNPPGAAYFNHKLILSGLFDWRGSRTERRPVEERPPSRMDESRRFFEDVRAAVAETQPRCLILSTESLFRVLPEAAPARLPGLLAGLAGDVTVAAYLRRPSEHYVSRLQQGLKASHSVRQPGAMKVRAILEQYAGIFGEDALALAIFHRPDLAGGDVVADFAARHLAPWGVTRADLAAPPRTNDTLSAESADISRRYRLAFHPDENDRFRPESIRLVEALRAADAAAGAPRPRLKPGVADLVDYGRLEPLWLRDRHGIVFPDFDYRRLEKGRLKPPQAVFALEDILEIDRGRERAVLAELRASRWGGERERRAWIDGLLAELA